MLILGFDPGGVKQFGWCVTEDTPTGELKLRRSGIADHAAGAVSSALQSVDNLDEIGGVGIDSPLYWVTKGTRRADTLIRREMSRFGAPNVGGTVQQVNSLRGACLAQGIMTAQLLRSEAPTVRITESHPKALLWLIEVATKERPVIDVRMSHLGKFIAGEADTLSDHQRDAALGAVAAWAMFVGLPGWRDLFLDEDQTFVPVAPVEYWMPIEKR